VVVYGEFYVELFLQLYCALVLLFVEVVLLHMLAHYCILWEVLGYCDYAIM